MNIDLKPIGYVRSPRMTPDEVPLQGESARIEILPQYREGLIRITEHTHIWVISWFHKAQRNVLSTVPMRMDSGLPVYGVFGLRSPRRPNPLGLTLVRLLEVDDLTLTVEGMDAIDGTPVIDIKSYYDGDIIFSAGVAYIRNRDAAIRLRGMLKHALAHHGEECPSLLTAVRMCFLAEELMGQLTSAGLFLKVTGPPCAADTLQGLTRARLAHPPRFSFVSDDNRLQVEWQKAGQGLDILVKRWVKEREEFNTLTDEEIFSFEWKTADRSTT